MRGRQTRKAEKGERMEDILKEREMRTDGNVEARGEKRKRRT